MKESRKPENGGQDCVYTYPMTTKWSKYSTTSIIVSYLSKSNGQLMPTHQKLKKIQPHNILHLNKMHFDASDGFDKLLHQNGDAVSCAQCLNWETDNDTGLLDFDPPKKLSMYIE